VRSAEKTEKLEEKADARDWDNDADREETNAHFTALCQALEGLLGPSGSLPIVPRMQFETLAERLGVPRSWLSLMSELFPSLPDALPPRNGYAALRPIGRIGSRHKSAVQPRRPSPTMQVLVEVLRAVALLGDIAPLLKRIEAELVVTAFEGKKTNELVDRLARQHVELRRDIGRTELHTFPHATRAADHWANDRFDPRGQWSSMARKGASNRRGRRSLEISDRAHTSLKLSWSVIHRRGRYPGHARFLALKLRIIRRALIS
jgi:hypothetical protein